MQRYLAERRLRNDCDRRIGNYLATLRARPGRQSQAIAEFMLPFEGPYRVLLSLSTELGPCRLL
jgi:hypothetical protein